ncbi:5-bromo-4-chloroindolyl phosphate hydrolysis protein [Candidatus Magnetoovum chiemensis]|nr:5-bromo-4-chloroindolyl phosphate hydrolysis protein [Candidatus Magnetoovum chiemensis]
MTGKSIAYEITIGLISAAAYLLFYVLIDLGLIASIIISVMIFLGLQLLMFKAKKQIEIDLEDRGLSYDIIQITLKEGKDKVANLQNLGASIEKQSVRAKVIEICEIANKILDNIEKNPEDVKSAKKFFSYYLDATITILNKYSEITKHKAKGSNIDTTIDKVESILDTIKEAFEKQHSKLYENDVIDLDTEISVLEQTLKSEGL